MNSLKLVQSLGAAAAIAGFFLPWSSVNFGDTIQKAVDLAKSVVPGGITNVGKLDDPNVAAAAVAKTAANLPGIAAKAKAVTQIQTGSFSGLKLALSGKLLLVNFIVPIGALAIFLVVWLTPRGTGKLGTSIAALCLAVLWAGVILSFITGLAKDAGSGTGPAFAPQGIGDTLKILLGYLQWGFWVSAGGVLLLLVISPFAKAPAHAHA